VKVLSNQPVEGCPPAYGGCTCSCHRIPGTMHVMPCCLPQDELEKSVELEEQEIEELIEKGTINLTFLEEAQNLSPGDEVAISNEAGVHRLMGIVSELRFVRLDKLIEANGGVFDLEQCKEQFGDGVDAGTMVKVVTLNKAEENKPG